MTFGQPGGFDWKEPHVWVSFPLVSERQAVEGAAGGCPAKKKRDAWPWRDVSSGCRAKSAKVCLDFGKGGLRKSANCCLTLFSCALCSKDCWAALG